MIKHGTDEMKQSQRTRQGLYVGAERFRGASRVCHGGCVCDDDLGAHCIEAVASTVFHPYSDAFYSRRFLEMFRNYKYLELFLDEELAPDSTMSSR